MLLLAAGSLTAWLATTPRAPLMRNVYEHLVFRPQDGVDRAGDEELLIKFDTVPNRQIPLTARDGSALRAWMFDNPGARRIFLYCMGRNSDIPSILDRISVLLETGQSVFAFEYRGFGKSSGRRHLRSMCEDARSACQTLTEILGFAADQIVVVGESLGTGAAGSLALTMPVAGLLLKSGFASLGRLGKELYPLPARLYFEWQFPKQFDNCRTASLVKMPLLLVHGLCDELIPHHHSNQILAASSDAQLVLLPESPHREIEEGDCRLFVSAVREWLGRLDALSGCRLTTAA